MSSLGSPQSSALVSPISSRLYVWGLPPLLAVVVCGLAVWQAGSLAAARSWFSGETVTLEPVHLVVSPVRSVSSSSMLTGDASAPSVVIRNLQFQPLQVLGATQSCDCAMATSLPAVVEPGRSLTIPLQVSRDARGVQTVTFFTDAKNAPRLTCRIEFRGE